MAISTLVVALTARTTDFERSLKSVEKSLDRTSSQIESVGASMSAGLTAPILALAGAATKLALDFDAPFDKMQSILGQSTMQTDALRDSVLQLAGQTAQSPKELGAALYDIQAAGIRGAAAMDVLKASAEASAIGLGSTKTVASFLAAELNAYGPMALSAAQATSVLIEAARVGRVNIDDLVSSVGAIMPIAAQAGVSFDQVAAAVSAMTRSGLEAGQAATGLRTILQTLEKPSSSVQKALAMVGLSAAALKDELQSKGLLATLQTLKTATEGNDEAIAQIFPNARTFAGVLSLLGANSSSTKSIFDSLAHTTTDTLGAAFRTAASQDGFQFQQALTQIQTSLIRLGNDLLPVIIPLVERFTKAIGDLSSWFEHLDLGSKDLAFVLLSIVASVGPLLLAFSALYSSAATVLGLFRLIIGLTGLANIFSTAAAAVSMLGASLAELVGFFKAFGAAETIADVILPALAGSALLAGGLIAAAAYLWISKWKELKEDMGIIVDFVVGKLQSMNAATRGFLGAMATAMFPGIALLMKLKPAIQDALGTAADVAVKAGGDLKDGFLTQVTGMEQGLGAIFGRMVASAKTMAAGIVGTAKGVGVALPQLPLPGSSGQPGGGLGPSKTDIQEQISLWQSLGATLQSQGNVMSVTLGAFKENAIQAAQTFKQQVGSMVTSTETTMGAMTASFLRGKESINQFVSDMIQAILKLIAKIVLLKALTAAGLGGGFSAGFVGGMFADGGRPPMNKVSVVGENGPELFVPDTAGTIIPNSALGGGGGTSVTVQQTVQISGLDLSSAAAARQLAVGLKEAARSGASEGVALSLQLSQTASKNSGRSV